jgi:hypothetical protein
MNDFVCSFFLVPDAHLVGGKFEFQKFEKALKFRPTTNRRVNTNHRVGTFPTFLTQDIPPTSDQLGKEEKACCPHHHAP